MGEPDVVHVDASALISVARQYDTVAEIVDDAVRDHLTGLAFGGATAGRNHVARGEVLRGAVDEIAVQLRTWSRAATEIAAALRDSADRYADADGRAARRVR